MKIKIICFGKDKTGVFDKYSLEYKKRMQWKVQFDLLKPKTSLPVKTRKVKEAEEMLRLVPKGSFVVSLDEVGENITSKQFYDLIEFKTDFCREIIFLIGSDIGLDKSIFVKSDKIIAFGKMTWPYFFVRYLLMEQIYRIYCINKGISYHRE